VRRVDGNPHYPSYDLGVPCPSQGLGNGVTEAAQLRALATQYGFPLP